MSVRFCPISSGSNGNCAFVSFGGTSILIDAGLSGKAIESGLNRINETCAGVGALFVTHEHSDHIKGAGILSRRYNLPIFASKGSWAAMSRRGGIGEIATRNRRVINKDEEIAVGGITVRPFGIPHDAAEPVGYGVFCGGLKICVATDIGHPSDDVAANLIGADILLLESNHDVDKLKNGVYPYALKRRVLSDHGHLSNAGCGRLLCRVHSPRLRHAVLGHLSGENNTPELAYETVSRILESNGIFQTDGFKLGVAVRGEVGAVIEM
jgi:phosphoribosyl 1,2-cyclic phosphodiesterase